MHVASPSDLDKKDWKLSFGLSGLIIRDLFYFIIFSCEDIHVFGKAILL